MAAKLMNAITSYFNFFYWGYYFSAGEFCCKHFGTETLIMN